MTTQATTRPRQIERNRMRAVMNNILLHLRDDAGAVRQAMLGPPWWWADNGIELLPGDPVELEGFESADHMEVNWIQNLRTGERLDLRTPEGMPVWQGAGPR